MKYKGNQVKGVPCEFVVFPRTKFVDGQEIKEDIVFKVEAVLDYSEFEALCPEPLAVPDRLVAGGAREPYPDHPDFKAKRSNWAQLRFHFMILQSLANTPEFEWEKVKSEDPSTWSRYLEELTEAGFTVAQINHLTNRIIAVNTIDESMMEKARANFILGMSGNGHSASHKVGQLST